MSQDPGGVFIANNVQGRLIKIEIKGRDAEGKFTADAEYELTTGEFQEITLPVNGSLQIFVKDD